MTKEEQYVMGRAEAINAEEGISFTEACKIAEQELGWEKFAKEKGKKIDHFFRVPGSVCKNCRFRKEYFKNVPDECKECGHLDERDAPYYKVLPSFVEEENKEE